MSIGGQDISGGDTGLAWSTALEGADHRVPVVSARAPAISRGSLQDLYGQLELLRQVLLDLPISMIAIDQHGNIILSNLKASEMFGYDPAELVRRPLSSLIPNVSVDLVRGGGPNGQVILTIEGRTPDEEIMARHRGDKLFAISVSLAPQVFGDGYVVFLSFHDMSRERKFRSALRQRDRLLKMIISGLPAMINAKDTEGRYLLINNHQAEIFGIEPEKATGRTTQEVMGDRHGTRIDELDRKVIKNGGLILNLEERFPDSDGREHVWLTTKAPVRDNQGKIVRLLTVSLDVTDIKVAERRADYMASHDMLTGLPGRGQFEISVQDALRAAKHSGDRVAVILLHMRNFNEIKNTFGYGTGDYVIRRSAIRLCTTVDESDTVARLDGGDFAVLLPKIGDDDSVKSQATEMIGKLAEPLAAGHRRIHIEALCGVALFPDGGHDVQSLLTNADLSLAQARKLGGDAVQFFTQGMDEAAKRRQDIHSAMRNALENENFTLFYQPQVDLGSGRIIGAEALLRWNDPVLGFVSPGEFVPLAEETGLIIPIGDWVLDTACRQTKAWLDAGLPSLVVGVNLSAQQFRLPDLPERVQAVLEDTQLPPHLLDLEVTETAAMHNAKAAEETLRELHKLGVQLSIDDFGTGYSSLMYLKRFPANRIKIDRTFLFDVPENADNSAIVLAIIKLCQTLHKALIAEGVETAEHVQFLYANGCHEAQGFYFSRPVPAEELRVLLEQGGVIKKP